MMRMTNMDFPPRHAPASAIPPAAGDNSEPVDILALFRLIRRRIGMIMVVTAILTMAAVPVILSMEKIYYAESRLLIQSPLTMTDAQDQNQLDLTNEVERLLSRAIAEQVIDTLDLDERAEFNPSLGVEPWTARLRTGLRNMIIDEPVTAPNDLEDMSRVVLAFNEHLSVQRNGTSQIVRIGFSSVDPSLAAQVPNTLLSTYFDEREVKLRERVLVAEDYLIKRIAAQRERVGAALAAVKAFREETGLLTDETEDDRSRTVSQLIDRRGAIQRERVALQASVRVAEAGLADDNLLGGLGSAPLDTLEAKLRDQEIELMRLQDNYGNEHLEVIAMRGEIRRTRAAMRTETQRHIASLETDLARLDEEQKAVDREIVTAQNTLSGLRLSEAGLASLTRIVQREQAQLDALEDQRRSLSAKAGLPAVEAEILSPATRPIWPEGRSRLIYLIGAVFLSALAAFTAACIRELADRSVRSPEQLEDGAPIEPAGMLPRLSSPKKSSEQRLTQGVRQILLSIQASNEGSPRRSIAVVSALSGEGKTLIATLLATELANSGKDVLFVECGKSQGRNPLVVGDPAQRGLSDYLDHRCDVTDIIHCNEENGISYVPWGTLNEVPLFDQRLLRAFMDHAGQNGYIILFDTPAILVHPEAAVIARMAELQLCVVKWGHTPRSAVITALERLWAQPNNPTLIAMNFVQPQRHALYGFRDSQYVKSLLPT